MFTPVGDADRFLFAALLYWLVTTLKHIKSGQLIVCSHLFYKSKAEC